MYHGNRYRTRDVVDVADEMEHLVKEMHFKSIYFDDDTFNIGKERMLKLCDEIKKRKLDIPWAIMARADLMNEEILKEMRDAGLFAIKYGVESATQEQLDSINKNMNIKKTEEVVRLTKKLGIRTHLTFTFGLPGETRESIQKTIDLALRLDPVTIQFSLATPFPGTVFYKEMKEKGSIISENWSEYDGNYKSVVASDNITRKELEYAIKSAYKQWAAHCLKKDRLKKVGYYRLMVKSFKKYGFFITLFKIVRNTVRYIDMFLNEKIWRRNAIEDKAKAAGLRIGRLTLLFHSDSLDLYWDGMKLTEGSGFLSSFHSHDVSLEQLYKEPWNFEKIDEREILLTRGGEHLAISETWKIKVIDEKQIDWDVDVRLKENIENLTGRIMLILTGRYKTWVDSWGEGRLFPIANYETVDLRNPNTDFIGFRGRRKLKGQLPTFFLDLSRNPDSCSPSIRNAKSILGARMLEVHGAILNDNGKHVSSEHNLFSVRIKIVEEDFKKRKFSKKK